VSGAREPALTAEEIARSPAWYPLETLPSGEVRLVQLEEAAYLEASFLDQRILALGYNQASCRAALLEAAAARLTPGAHYIFHTGHVGSTLISRLLGAHPGIFALREPALLREFAAAGRPRSALTLRTVQALLSRTWRAGDRVLIKATSFVSELAATILGGAERPTAICVYASPLAYLRGILAGPNSRLECQQLALVRRERLSRRFRDSGWCPELRSEGETIAMSWLCEMSALEAAARRCRSQVLWVDFDAFLGEVAAGLSAMLRALGVTPCVAALEAIVSGPVLRQYSKAPQHAYDAALRRELLESADREHAVEIRRGMAWLEAASARDAAIAAVAKVPPP
jgi:hypothetical protein